jgi:cytochrome c biogenesis protein CcmG/thiol:disulfide interchange protein DsbE
MLQKAGKEKQEQQVARTQRRDLEAELAEQYAQLPRRPRNRRRTAALLVFAAIAVLVGLYGLLVLLPSPAQTPMAGVAVGKAAPDFTLPILGGANSGGSITLRTLHGHPVVVNFWSESCIPCRAEVPYLQRTYAQYASHGEFTLLGINQADPRDDIATFGRQFKVTYPLLFDKGSAVNTAYGITAIPTTYLIDGHGIVRAASITQLTPALMKRGLAAIGVSIPG